MYRQFYNHGQPADRMKECTLRLWDRGWELEDIREALGVSRRSYVAGDGWFLGLVLL